MSSQSNDIIPTLLSVGAVVLGLLFMVSIVKDNNTKHAALVATLATQGLCLQWKYIKKCETPKQRRATKYGRSTKPLTW